MRAGLNQREPYFAPHRPAVGAAAMIAAGILIDRVGEISFRTWLGASVCSIAVAILAGRLRGNNATVTFRALLVLAGVVSIGGARHHQFWSLRRTNNILAFTQDEKIPIRLVGVIETPVDIIEAEHGPRIPSWLEVDRSLCMLRCERLDDAGNWRPVSGRVRIDVSGQFVHADIGDRVEVLGELIRTHPPENPGGFDFRDYLKRQGADCLVSVNHPAAITRLAPGHGVWTRVMRWRTRIREECNRMFMLHLSSSSRALAQSLLIGDRSRMTDELRGAFAESGTMHLLAISGLHVGILAWLLWLLCRGANFSPRVTTIAIMVGVLGYAFFTNHRPPVLRAAALTTITLLGYSRYRQVDGYNTLGVCAALLLLWNPGDLFDVGFQLSFLAVGAILWALSWGEHLREHVADLRPERGPVRALLDPALRWLGRGYAVTGAIWFATLPMTITWFHLVAPIGFLINVLLIPCVAVVLGLGYLFLFVSLVAAPLSAPCAALFDGSLNALLSAVQLAQGTSFGHFYVSAPPNWWLVAFYGLLAVSWQLLGTPRTAGWAARMLLIWIAVGLSHGTITAADRRCAVHVSVRWARSGDGHRAARRGNRVVRCGKLWGRNTGRTDD